MRRFGLGLGLALILAGAAWGFPCPGSTTWTVGNCEWCGVAPHRDSQVTYYWQAQGQLCVPVARRYSWYPCFSAVTCSVADVEAGRCRDRSVLGNHVTKDADDWQSYRIRRLERRMYACLSGHGL
jgi:hypothetical protein